MYKKDNYFIAGAGSALIITPWLIALLDGMFPQNELLNTAIFSLGGILTFVYALRTKEVKK